MAPPKLFINTKTLDVEKQSDHLEKDEVDGMKTESQDEIKEDPFFPLDFVGVSCIGLGLTSIGTGVSFLAIIFLPKNTCLRFRLLSYVFGTWKRFLCSSTSSLLAFTRS